MKKAKKIIISLSIFLTCAISLICIGLKANASNNTLTIDAVDSRNYSYLVIVGPYQWGASLNTNALNINYSVMGNEQTPKNVVVIGNDGYVHYNFLNGDMAQLEYHANYIYFYMVDLSQNVEYYGYCWSYDFETQKPIYDYFTHNATYTQYTINTFNMAIWSFVQCYFERSGISPNTLIPYLFNQSYFYGYVLDNALSYAYDEKQNGYTEGYYTGLQDGEEGKSPLTRVWEIIGGVFNAVANVMSIELFPSIPVGIFFLVPLVFGAVGFIFWIWKRGG